MPGIVISRLQAGRSLLRCPYLLCAEVYRRAVDLNPRDYRAWYGLGQTYELLHMPYHALYYFRCSSEPTLGLCAVDCCNHMAGQVR